MSYRLYLDESGDHFRENPDKIGARYLGLVGVMFEDSEDCYWEFSDALDEIKRKHLPYHPDDPPILHRTDIIAASGPFYVLQDEEVREEFDEDLLKLMADAEYRVVGVVIDKYEHGEKEYRSLTHPYHYCMEAMLERFCGLLDLWDEDGEVVAEARGGRENRALRNAYRKVYREGTRYMDEEQVKRTLAESEVEIRQKGDNVAGLQLADLLAHPVTRDVLEAFDREEGVLSEHAERIMDIVTRKYNHHEYNGRVRGYGRVFLD